MMPVRGSTFGVFEQQLQRTIFGGMQKNNVLQLIMIHELVALFGESIIWKVSKAGRKRFARNGSRMSDSNLATFVFARNPDGTVVQVADDLVSVGCSRG